MQVFLTLLKTLEDITDNCTLGGITTIIQRKPMM